MEDVTVFFSVYLRGECLGVLAPALFSPNDMLDIPSSSGATRNGNFITALKFSAESLRSHQPHQEMLTNNFLKFCLLTLRVAKDLKWAELVYCFDCLKPQTMFFSLLIPGYA